MTPELIEELLSVSLKPHVICDEGMVMELFKHVENIDLNYGVGDWVLIEFLPELYSYFREREEQLVKHGVQLMAKIAELENKEKQ